MESEFDAYKLSHNAYPSIFNSFPVIQTASAKNRRFHVPQPTFLFPLETPLRLSRNMLHGWKDNSMLANSSVGRNSEWERLRSRRRVGGAWGGGVPQWGGGHPCATLPVTTCTSERSFSTLRRLKTCSVGQTVQSATLS